MTAPLPGIGEWYRHTGGDLFEVVAFDEDDGTIEIQYFDGTVEEMDTEDWDSSVGRPRAREAPSRRRTGPAPSMLSQPMMRRRGSDISGDESDSAGQLARWHRSIRVMRGPSVLSANIDVSRPQHHEPLH